MSEKVIRSTRRTDRNREELEKVKENIKKLTDHEGTEEIKYPAYKEAYEYVDNLFPGVGVKDIKIYKASSFLMEKLGFGSAGGFYDKIYKNIIISSTSKLVRRNLHKYSIQAHITKDEVIVHELIHYCFNEDKISSSREIQEEYAYGYSIGYLRKKGYSDKQIIKNNFLPYLYQISYQKSLKSILGRRNIGLREYQNYSDYKKTRFMRANYKYVFSKAMEIANEKGQQIVDVYNKKLENHIPMKNINKKEVSRFNIMDI